MTPEDRALIHRRMETWREDLSVEEKCAPYRAMTPDERAVWVVAACRDAMVLLQAHSDPAAVLEHRDPMPPESAAVWDRLRRGCRRARRA